MQAASTVAPAVMPQPQHMQALAHANRVRLARASLKREIATGAVDAAEIVRQCPWEVESMTVGELLRSQRRWGRTRARKFAFSIARYGRHVDAPAPHSFSQEEAGAEVTWLR